MFLGPLGPVSSFCVFLLNSFFPYACLSQEDGVRNKRQRETAGERSKGKIDLHLVSGSARPP